MDVDPQVVELGVRFGELAARNTGAAIADRIKVAKAAKRDRQAIVALEEIITNLSEDRNELLQLAQAYREKVAAQTISEADVAYITDQVIPKVREVVAMTAETQGADRDTTEEMLDILSSLVSVEALTVLQLLGFNFKRAIGEPLTNLVAQAISSRANPDPATAADLQRLNAQNQLAAVELARDPDAFARFNALFRGA